MRQHQGPDPVNRLWRVDGDVLPLRRCRNVHGSRARGVREDGPLRGRVCIRSWHLLEQLHTEYAGHEETFRWLTRHIR